MLADFVWLCHLQMLHTSSTWDGDLAHSRSQHWRSRVEGWIWVIFISQQSQKLQVGRFCPFWNWDSYTLKEGWYYILSIIPEVWQCCLVGFLVLKAHPELPLATFKQSSGSLKLYICISISNRDSSLSDSILGGWRHFFLLTLYNLKTSFIYLFFFGGGEGVLKSSILPWCLSILHNKKSGFFYSKMTHPNNHILVKCDPMQKSTDGSMLGYVDRQWSLKQV